MMKILKFIQCIGNTMFTKHRKAGTEIENANSCVTCISWHQYFCTNYFNPISITITHPTGIVERAFTLHRTANCFTRNNEWTCLFVQRDEFIYFLISQPWNRWNNLRQTGTNYRLIFRPEYRNHWNRRKKRKEERTEETWQREEERKWRTKREMSERKGGSTCCDFHQSGTRSSAKVKSDTDLEGNTARWSQRGERCDAASFVLSTIRSDVCHDRVSTTSL